MTYKSQSYSGNTIKLNMAFGEACQMPATIESEMLDHISKIFYGYGKFIVQARMHGDTEAYASLLRSYNNALTWLASRSVPEGFIADDLKNLILGVHGIVTNEVEVPTTENDEEFKPFYHRILGMDTVLARWQEELLGKNQSNDANPSGDDVQVLRLIENVYIGLAMAETQEKHMHDEDCNAVGWANCGYGCFFQGERNDECDIPHECTSHNGYSYLYLAIHNGYTALEAGVEDDELRMFLLEGVEQGLFRLNRVVGSMFLLASKSNFDFNVHRRMAEHPHSPLRKTSANDEHCPDEVLLYLAKDENTFVLDAVYRTLALRSSEVDHQALVQIAGSDDTPGYLLHLLIQDRLPFSWTDRPRYRDVVADLARENLSRRAGIAMEDDDPNTAFHGVTLMVHKVMNEPDFEDMFSGLKVKEKAMARKKNASFTDMQLAEMFPGGLSKDLKAFTDRNPHFPLGILSAWVKRDDPDQRLRWFPMLAFYLVAVVSRTRYWGLGFTSVNYSESDNRKYAQYAR